MTYDGPILDNHFHLNRSGLCIHAAKEFEKAGWTHIVLVHCPDFSSPPTTKQGHIETYQDTIDIAAEVRNATDLHVRVVLGPHPAAFAHQFEKWVARDGEEGKERAIENYRHSIDAALDFVQEGQAHAIGEVGRPHWNVSEEIWALSNMLLEETFHLAAQHDIPLQLHVEGDSDETYVDLSSMATRQGMNLKSIIRHYSPPNVSKKYTHGLTPSVLIGKGALDELVDTCRSSSHGFLLETDYMDDLRRPGAVLGPKTVPKRTKQLAERGIDEEILWRTHHDLPNELYGQ
ncbi:MAG: TatD family hydrolase [archaeon]|nr:TatD family hydrolase [archaeon]